MSELHELSACALVNGYSRRVFSPVEVVDALASRIDRLDPLLGAFSALCLERAQAEAAAHERAYADGRPCGPLAGVPVGVKDVFDSEGVRTAYGSPMFAEHVPSADAEAVRRARSAGAILVGKTQTHEFAWGITSVNPLMGTSRNPWAPGRMSGGSSGGSAVALAAHLVPLALGSDTGGSIRVPSAFCGTIGLKPTYGRISAAGVFPLAASLDHPGPMARTPEDVALLLEAVSGVDPDDPATEDVPLGMPRRGLGDGLHGLRLGLCSDLHPVAPAADVQATFDATVRVAADLGADLVEVRLPEAEHAYTTFVTTQRAEALFTHAQAGLFPSRRDEYGDDVRGRLEAATAVTLSEFLAAAADRQRLRAGFARLLRQVDLLLTPVSAGSPLPIGEERLVHLGRELEFRELVMGYTVPQDLTGLPACTVRAGFDDLGIPVGVQLTGPPWSEQLVLRGAYALHEATPGIQERRPDLTAAAAP